MNNKKYILILLTLLASSSFNLFSTELTIKEFSSLYVDEIIKGKCSVNNLELLLEKLIKIKIEIDSEDQIIRESIVCEICRQIRQAELEKLNIKTYESELSEQTEPNGICKDPIREVNNLLDWAKKNKYLMCEYKIINKNKDIESNIYQLKVYKQDDGPTCGPRALFNNYTIIKYFQSSDIKILDELNLRDPAKIFLFQNVKNIIARDPKNLKSDELEKVTNNYKLGDTVKIIDAYKSIDIRQLSGIIGHGYIEDEKPERIIIDDQLIVDIIPGIAYIREIGYYQGFVINPRDGGHWICLFCIKTEEKKYSWFIMDSCNRNYNKSNIIKTYIKKLLD